jgi:hypothetical protein
MKINNPSIHQLRCNNYKVFVQHDERGNTRIVITDPGGYHAEGIARKDTRDTFNRKLGNKIALGRALSNLKSGNNVDFVFVKRD